MQYSYLIDWEIWFEATPKDAWDDRLYMHWNLAQCGRHGDLDDMSTWIL